MTSALWQTNAVALRAGGEAVLIDSPYFPDELEMLPEVLRQSGFEPAGLLATHERLPALVGDGEVVVPGHGSALARDSAQRVLEEDVAYLDFGDLPAGRFTPPD